MPTISIRGNEMPASPIRKLAPLADAAKQRGVHVFHLNIGQPDLPTPQAAIDAIRNIDRKVLEYSPSAGYRSYREKLVGYYAKFNINLTADDIIITSGGSEAVLFSFLSCLNPGDEIIVPEPAYANYMAFAISAGAKIRTIATTIEEGFSLPKVEKFEELINELQLVLDKHQTPVDLALLSLGNLTTHLISTRIPAAQQSMLAESFAKALLTSISPKQAH